MIGVAFVVLHFTHIEAPSNMQKRAYEDAVGYSTQANDAPSPQYGQSGGGFAQGGNPQYPSANYANPGTV